MKKFFSINFCLLLVVLATNTAFAQEQPHYSGKLNIATKEVVHRGDSIIVDLELAVSRLTIDRERAFTITPLIATDQHNRQLPSIIINGSVRHKLYRRQIKSNKGMPKTDYAELKSGSNDVVHYRVSIFCEPWMQNARVDLMEDLCGCAGHSQQISVERLSNHITEEIIKRDYYVQPLLAFIRPEMEPIKKRNELYELYLDFPVGKTQIYRDFRNNATELTKIKELVEDLNADKNVTITGVTIKGNTSPEGSEELNKRLSKGRAESLRQHLISAISLKSLYQVEEGGEDWNGFKKLMQVSTSGYKDELLQIIELEQPVDKKESLFKILDQGRAYKELLNNVFPQLRRVDGRIDYRVRAFNEEEAKEVFQKHPQQLSMEEMFRLANSYKSTDSRFGDIFEVAVRLYPNDPIANLNAASSLLMQGVVTDRVAAYLEKALKGTPEYINDCGVYYLLKGDYIQARQWLEKAKEQGSIQAEHNLEELEKKIDSLK
ncbi:DUF3868 domain-containing protein [Bacteroides reticulotermitis]|uniref:Immunoreactive 53 kDa antigen PG123 n=2 Tax=Bacteroides reticulotermitis TaxID=1133319 RepID=W4UUD1_9BACE|nr:DUF3868 domain-containing protein [Bacteroides reticulotermitis]MBB4045292.1 hypothetical protein [Bacteroides reticulotermitis]GAE84233.1 immunoreactive 53 kDa antigen PG123 [Bacteroides reticulotermitis JCM 10512]